MHVETTSLIVCIYLPVCLSQFTCTIICLQRFEASISLPSARPAPLITESPSSARLLHSSSASASSFTPLASAASASSAHHYQHPEAPVGQTWIHPGQWRKHKLLEYWSCCQVCFSVGAIIVQLPVIRVRPIPSVRYTFYQLLRRAT